MGWKGQHEILMSVFQQRAGMSPIGKANKTWLQETGAMIIVYKRN